MSKFARGNRFSIAEHQERYKEEAQRIFELQNRLLGSIEELSTDEDESEDDEDMDFEEMGKNIENIIANKKTSDQLSHEKEEEERRELHKLLMGSNQNEQQNDKNKQLASSSKKPTASTSNTKQTAEELDNEDSLSMSNQGKLLKIYRTYRNPDGKEFIRIETVRKPAVITAYVKLRQTKDPEQIKKFTQSLDENEKEEYRKVKRRLQEQLRRLKRNAEKNQMLSKTKEPKLSLSDEPDRNDTMSNQLNLTTATNSIFDDSSLNRTIGSANNSLGIGFNFNLTNNATSDNSNEPILSTNKSKKEKKEKEPKKEPKVRCGSCGQTGHMKTNRICPMYTGELPPINVAMTEEELREQKETIQQDNLIKVDDTKLIFSKQLFINEEEIRKKSLILKVPKDILKRKRRAGNNDEYCDYLDKPEYKQANRRRKDPLVSLSIYFEQIISEIKQLEGADIFWLPVNSKKVKDYYNIITMPMDIQTIKKKVSEKQYKSRDEFLGDWTQIFENSRIYNGLNHQLTLTAQRFLDLVKQRIDENDKIAVLERTINPLLDNDQVAFSFILESVVLPRLRSLPDSYAFHHPVNKKNVKNYYDVIKNPIDLETILANVKEHKYHSRQMFLNDVELMYNNCVQFNGEESVLSKKAYELLEIARQCIEENEDKLKELESSIAVTKEALDDNEDSVSVGLSNEDLADRPNSRLSNENSQPGSLIISQEGKYFFRSSIMLFINNFKFLNF